MNLVIQGEDVSTPDLKELHRLSRGAAIERIHDEAFRITKADASTKAEVAAHAARAKLDFGFVDERRTFGDFRLLAMDMDSTLISIECIDEIADFAGRKAEVAAVTESAMRGELGFDHAYSNNLDVDGTKLAGTVSGPLVDAAGKAAHVARLKRELGISRAQVIAMGDGANDLPMMAEAGTSVAYHAKPVVKAKADYALDYVGLDGLLTLFPASSGLSASR